MKKFIILLFIPMVCVSQNHDCGERPIKPLLLENQSKKEFKESNVYIEYKKNLKIWRTCMSPRAMSERDEQKMEKSLKLKSEIALEKFKEKISDPCGEKPEKPTRETGQKHDEYIKTSSYLEYKKNLKAWKKCKSPQGISKRNQETMDKDFEKIQKAILEDCGEKPKKPIRAKGLNNEEYKQSPEHIKYRENLKLWKKCSSASKKKATAGPCGEKPIKPFREEGMDHQKYRETPEHLEYQKKLKNWRDCNTEFKKANK